MSEMFVNDRVLVQINIQRKRPLHCQCHLNIYDVCRLLSLSQDYCNALHVDQVIVVHKICAHLPYLHQAKYRF